MKLTKIPCWNPYGINGKQVSRIVLFNHGEVVVNHDRGWLGDSNNYGNDVLESLDFVARRKVNLEREEAFYIGDVIYIHTSLLPDFKYLGEQVVLETASQIHYGNFFSFSCGHTNTEYEHLQRVEERLFMAAYYTRSELTPHGERVAEIKRVALKGGVKLTDYEIEKLISVKEQLIPLLQGGE